MQTFGTCETFETFGTFETCGTFETFETFALPVRISGTLACRTVNGKTNPNEDFDDEDTDDDGEDCDEKDEEEKNETAKAIDDENYYGQYTNDGKDKMTGEDK